MKKILSYLFLPILYILLVTFYLLTLPKSTGVDYFFAISLIVEALFIGTLSIILNKDKRKPAKLFYILTISSISLSLVLLIIYYTFTKTLADSTIYYWIIYFSIALYISFFAFQVIYTFKNFFKKGYSIEKFDFNHFVMILNSAAYGLITYFFSNNLINICKNGWRLDEFNNVFYIYKFDFSSFLWPTVYISIGYIALYALISIIYYVKFGKDIRN